MGFDFKFFATCPKGIEPLLAEELQALGARAVRPTRAGVAFAGPLGAAYRACLWSRLASRVLLPLKRFPAPTPEALYEGVQSVAWQDHLAPDGTLAVDFTTAQSAIAHSHFGALKVKDAIVDQLRAQHGVRPSVDTERPQLRVNLYLHRDEATLSLDLSGESLHRRGYRGEGGAAPLKENLAAAILLRARWPAIAAQGGALIDLLCGSGTLPIEGALMAGDIAPGLLRPYFGFLQWRGHDGAIWAELLAQAHQRRAAGLIKLPPIRGYDHDARAVRAAKENLQRAGLAEHVRIQRRALGACAPEEALTGLVVANPPYGERLGEAGELSALYAELGAAIKRCYAGFQAVVFTGNAELGRELHLRPARSYTLYNGALECKLLSFDLAAAPPPRALAKPKTPALAKPLSAGAQMLANRLRKNLKHLGRWAARAEIYAYRLYDADLPEYNFAIDVYECDRRYVHAQEYEAPATVASHAARRRLDEALAAIQAALEIGPGQLFLKQRRRQKGGGQYERLDSAGEFHEVREGPGRFLVNFTDYLDTGLFLDHRLTRQKLGTLAAGRSVLNLFGYTGSATVYAGLGGATATTTVDLSHTYVDWARRNLALNGLAGGRHELIQADVLDWLKENRRRRYGVIFLDPPTFSRSKRMQENLDVQRDHARLIMDTAALLEPDGELIFSTNNRRFRLERAALAGFSVEDMTRATLPKDFERNPRIHQCFRIRRNR